MHVKFGQDLSIVQASGLANRTTEVGVSNEDRATFAILDRADPLRTVLTHLPEPSSLDVHEAVALAQDAAPQLESCSREARRDCLLAIAECLKDSRERLAGLICREVAKPIRASREEVDRAARVFQLAAMATMSRPTGSIIPAADDIDGQPAHAFVQESPAGVCAAITSFNYPLAGVAQKLAPALAAGCPVIIKPSRIAALSALEVMRLSSACAPLLPQGWVACCPCRDELIPELLGHEAIRAIALTGSRETGRSVQDRYGGKKLLLELGGNTPAIVDQGVDVQAAARSIAYSAFRFAGQTCTSVQRLIVHEGSYDALRHALCREIRALRVGQPLSEQTDIGPVISLHAARRFDELISSATAEGAEILIGGESEGRECRPTILEHVPPSHSLEHDEAFLPVISMRPFTDFADAVSRANATPFGLQALVFSNRLDHVQIAARALQFGSLIFNGSSGRRGDHLPFGGVKQSGQDREGIDAMISALSVRRTLIFPVSSATAQIRHDEVKDDEGNS